MYNCFYAFTLRICSAVCTFLLAFRILIRIDIFLRKKAVYSFDIFLNTSESSVESKRKSLCKTSLTKVITLVLLVVVVLTLVPVVVLVVLTLALVVKSGCCVSCITIASNETRQILIVTESTPDAIRVDR